MKVILQQDVRIGEHDGERRLNLVRGVGHELPLLLPRALHRAQGPAREEHADHEEDGECDHADACKGEREGLPSACGADIGKRDARDAGVGGALLVEQSQLGELSRTIGGVRELGYRLLEHVVCNRRGSRRPCERVAAAL